jgi:hypothetical protein
MDNSVRVLNAANGCQCHEVRALTAGKSCYSLKCLQTRAEEARASHSAAMTSLRKNRDSLKENSQRLFAKNLANKLYYAYMDDVAIIGQPIGYLPCDYQRYGGLMLTYRY